MAYRRCAGRHVVGRADELAELVGKSLRGRAVGFAGKSARQVEPIVGRASPQFESGTIDDGDQRDASTSESIGQQVDQALYGHDGFELVAMHASADEQMGAILAGGENMGWDHMGQVG